MPSSRLVALVGFLAVAAGSTAVIGDAPAASTPPPVPVPARVEVAEPLAAASDAERVLAARTAQNRQPPARLVLRVWDLPGESDTPRVDVIEPRGIAWPPFATEGPQQLDEEGLPTSPPPARFASDGTPRLRPGFELVQAYAPDPGLSHVQYYVYQVDLNNYDLARQWRALQRAYRREWYEARAEYINKRNWETRHERLLSAHALALREGLTCFQAGDYREAIISLTRAADLDQGDPLCRIYLALARVAVGHDPEAGAVLRRGLQLQPRLVTMRLDLEQYYARPADLAAHAEALANRLTRRRYADADEFLLLGFLEFQRGRLDEAHLAFRNAAQLRPHDDVTRKFLDVTKPVSQ